MKTSIWPHKPDKFRKECKRLCALCQRIIAGQESVIEGSHKIIKYIYWMKETENTTWDVFRRIELETLDLPANSTRKYWDKNVLILKDKELEKIETTFREQAINAAQIIQTEYMKYAQQDAASNALRSWMSFSVRPTKYVYN